MIAPATPRSRVRRTDRAEARAGWHGLGPGLVTGAWPTMTSGISTYTIAERHWSTYNLLVCNRRPPPMNYAVQSICARTVWLGWPRPDHQHREALRALADGLVALLFVANVVNIAADLGAIAAIALLTPILAASS
ncbi:MAG: hypothetical protein U0360_03340 [Dehalococcoidia bacterium]